jgi:hypothetical protein
MGVSIDATDFCGGRDRFNGELVDGAADALDAGAGGDFAGDSVLLSLADKSAVSVAGGYQHLPCECCRMARGLKGFNH